MQDMSSPESDAPELPPKPRPINYNDQIKQILNTYKSMGAGDVFVREHGISMLRDGMTPPLGITHDEAREWSANGKANARAALQVGGEKLAAIMPLYAMLSQLPVSKDEIEHPMAKKLREAMLAEPKKGATVTITLQPSEMLALRANLAATGRHV